MNQRTEHTCENLMLYADLLFPPAPDLTQLIEDCHLSAEEVMRWTERVLWIGSESVTSCLASCRLRVFAFLLSRSLRHASSASALTNLVSVHEYGVIFHCFWLKLS